MIKGLKSYILAVICLCLSVLTNAQSQININQSAHIMDTDSVSDRTVMINNIYILGNEKTKRSIITRELSVKQGESVGLHKLIGYQTEDAQKIYNTNLFNTVDIEILELDTSNVDLLIKVTERWYLYPGVIFELSDRNFNDWWVNRNHDLSRVNYGVNLSKYNLRGRDETLLLTAQFGFEKIFLLNYVMPYIDQKQRYGLILDAGYAEYKNLPYRTVDHLPYFLVSRDLNRRAFGVSVSPSYRPSFYTKHFITAGFSTTNISDTVTVLNPEYLGTGTTSQKYFRLSYSFRKDHRNNQTYPLTGSLLTASLGKNGLGIFNEFDRWFAGISYSQYLDLGREFYLGSKLSGHVSSRDVPYLRQSSLGFENFLVRGYELSVIEGYAIVLFKNSLRYRLLNKSFSVSEKYMPLDQFQRWPLAIYAKMFFDAGYVQNYPNYSLNTRLSNKAIYGVGVGLDFVTIHDLTIRLEQSYNAEGNYNFVLAFKHDFY